MAKHRKTRQEKMVADQRHVSYHLDIAPAKDSTPSEKKSTSANYKLNILTNNVAVASYAYVKNDLRKTATVTAAIIIAQIFLFIVLNRI